MDTKYKVSMKEVGKDWVDISDRVFDSQEDASALALTLKRMNPSWEIQVIEERWVLARNVVEQDRKLSNIIYDETHPGYDFPHSEVLAHKDEILKAVLFKFKEEGSKTHRDGHSGYWFDSTDWTDEDDYRLLLDLKANQLCTYTKARGARKYVLESEESLDDPYVLESLQVWTY